MQIKEAMSSHPVIFTPQNTLGDTAETMRRVETGFVPVGENYQLVETITDRYIVINSIDQCKNAESAINEVQDSELGGVKFSLKQRGPLSI